MTYSEFATDQYMLSVLAEELTVDEADNALTTLTTLTHTSPAYFPPERTFVRPDHHRGVDGPTGVRFIVYGEEGVVRSLRLPRECLGTLKEAIDDIYLSLEALTRLSAA
jgi:hypothetical protein